MSEPSTTKLNVSTSENLISLENYINGELIPPNNKGYLDVYAPSTGSVFAKVPSSDETDLNNAIDAAENAYKSWSILPKQERSNIMLKIADLIDKNIDELAAAESLDNGKPMWLAKKVDIPRASANMRFFATAILHFASESHHMENTAINYTRRDPLGTVACISPWNLPLYLFTWKIAPALAAGNAVIAKPSEVTPYSAFLFSKLCIEAGLPKGVLNIVHGQGPVLGETLTTHPKIKAISFTGGTTTGATIASKAAPLFKKLSLELGGKNPNIIFSDCDYKEMMDVTMRSSFSNQGQICLCGSRIFIEENIYEQFKTDFVKRTSELMVNHPRAEKVDIGAVVSEAHMNKILEYIDLSIEEGGVVLCGGKRVYLDNEYSNGYYIEPTVIENLDPYCRVNQEEIFGPVVTITPFRNENEVIEWANCTEFGLSATLWTQNLKRAHQLANEIDSGIVWINTWLLRDLRTPFGGMKNSGVGREGGFEALKFFTEPKNVCVKL